MRKHGLLLGVVCAALAALLSGARIAAADGDADADLELLHAAGKKTDTASLLQFVAQQAKHDVDRAAVERLIEQLGSDEFEKREKASAALLALGPSALAALRPVSQHKDPEITTRMANCIRQLEQDQGLVGPAVRVLVRRDPEENISTLLRSSDPDIRCLCLKEVEAIGRKAAKVVSDLIEALADPVEAVRKQAQDALSPVLGPEHKDTILNATIDKKPEVREQALRLLWHFRDKPKVVVPPLLAALHDDSALVRRQAAATLWNFGAEEGVVSALIEALEDKDLRERPEVSSVAETAASSLGSIGKPARAAIPALIAAIQTGRPELQDSATRTLGYLGAQDDEAAKLVAPTLCELLSHKQNPYLRGIAAFALSHWGTKAKVAAPQLIKALDVSDIQDSKIATMVRGNVLGTLRGLGAEAKGAVPKLIEIVRDSQIDLQYRVAAVEALGHIGPEAKTAIPALTEVAGGPWTGADLREKARKALKDIQP